jgi:hypothetical protein
VNTSTTELPEFKFWRLASTPVWPVYVKAVIFRAASLTLSGRQNLASAVKFV